LRNFPELLDRVHNLHASGCDPMRDLTADNPDSKYVHRLLEENYVLFYAPRKHSFLLDI
jgi:hypothetical protein